MRIWTMFHTKGLLLAPLGIVLLIIIACGGAATAPPPAQPAAAPAMDTSSAPQATAVPEATATPVSPPAATEVSGMVTVMQTVFGTEAFEPRYTLGLGETTYQRAACRTG